MKCFLDRKKHPYFILNPLKTEMLSEYPYIVQFYDVLGEDTIQEMYTSRGTLKVSTVGGSQLGGLDLGSRTSAGTLLSDEYEDKIRAKTELLTGLHLEYEVVQNVEYVYGRMYQSHRDTVIKCCGILKIAQFYKNYHAKCIRNICSYSLKVEWRNTKILLWPSREIALPPSSTTYCPHPLLHYKCRAPLGIIIS